MNKYEELFKDILDRTRKNQMTWNQLKRWEHSDIIFDSKLVIRQYSAKYEKNDNTFKVIVVEKKYLNDDYDFDKYVVEILILDSDDELVTILTDAVIDRNNMLRLVELIEQKSDKAKKLFDSTS